MVEAALPGRDLLAAAPIPGGLVNTNLALTLDRAPHRAVLRLYQRDATGAAREAAIDRMLPADVPRARFLHVADGPPLAAHPWALLESIDGTRLDLLAANASDTVLAQAGAAVGATLAAIHAVRFPRAGFFDAALHVADAIHFGGAGLRAYLDETVRHGRAGTRLGPDLSARLLAYADTEASRLDAWIGPPHLVHADFNPTNILMARRDGAWRVAAVLDWEFALSAHAFFDFGNLLRPPLGLQAAFTDALATAYVAAAGTLPRDWRDLARVGDLFAWADLLSRPREDPELIADGCAAVAATVVGTTA
jgi:aminoglycoside phosphotransferase (APT) family kinase protein